MHCVLTVCGQVLRLASIERCNLADNSGSLYTSTDIQGDERLAKLNIVIVLAGKYFGQEDKPEDPE